MRRRLINQAAVVACLLALSACATAANDCAVDSGLTLQVLGSGGPIADDGRSSASYLVWLDGRARILVDVGGGAFLRFGEAGATFTDLDHIALSHFHTDHSADLVTLLKTGVFSDRERDLGISGPGGGGPFPGLGSYLESSIGQGGAYGYLSGYLDGSGGVVRLQPTTLDPDNRTPMAVVGDSESLVQIDAISVPHGIVPALAYRMRVGDKLIVFAGDQNGNDEEFIDFARNADVLVMHMVVPEGITGAGRALHAPPSRIGEIADAADARTLVLSHFMARSLADLDANVGHVSSRFNGETILAEDLLCISVD